MSSTTLYRFFNSDGELLYVGITGSPYARWKHHGQRKAWWSQVATITVEHFALREQAGAAEIDAITTEDPRYNIMGKGAGAKASVEMDVPPDGRLADGSPWWVRRNDDALQVYVDWLERLDDDEPLTIVANEHAQRGVGAIMALHLAEEVTAGCGPHLWIIPCYSETLTEVLEFVERAGGIHQGQILAGDVL